MTMARIEEDTTVAQGVQDGDMTENEVHGKMTHHNHHLRNVQDAHTRDQIHHHPVALVALYLHNRISSVKETMQQQQNLS